MVNAADSLDDEGLGVGCSRLRDLLLELAPLLTVRVDEDKCLERFAPDRAGKGERFASLERGANEIRLELIRVGTDRNNANGPSERLLACKSRQRRFCFRGLDRSLLEDVGKWVQVHLSICRARRLI